MERTIQRTVRAWSSSCSASQWVQLKVPSNARSGESCVAFPAISCLKTRRAVTWRRVCTRLWFSWRTIRAAFSGGFNFVSTSKECRLETKRMRGGGEERVREKKIGKSGEDRGRSSLDVLDGFVTCATTATMVETLKVELDYHPDSIKPPSSESPCGIISDVAFLDVHVPAASNGYGDATWFYALKCTLMMSNPINEKDCDISQNDAFDVKSTLRRQTSNNIYVLCPALFTWNSYRYIIIIPATYNHAARRTFRSVSTSIIRRFGCRSAIQSLHDLI